MGVDDSAGIGEMTDERYVTRDGGDGVARRVDQHTPEHITQHDGRAAKAVEASNWIRFLRGYGPVPCNDNMYDEFIRRSARRLNVQPLQFDHPQRAAILACVASAQPTSVVLTGTAGDGKTHLCRQIWEAIGADPDVWHSKEPYLRTPLVGPGFSTGDGDGQQGGSQRILHVVRDLSAWAPQRGALWDPAREELLQRFSISLFAGGSPQDVFLIAANDGQLMESWHRLRRTEAVVRAQEALETLLVEDRQALSGISLRFFNLSRTNSAELFDRAVAAFLAHPGWAACRDLEAGPGEFFGPDCPIRRNMELLATPLVQQRLRALLSLCDQNRLHLPIRQILLLLANAVLGHPDAKERLMTAADVPVVLRAGTVAKASLYNNLFGGNLSDTRREGTPVFDALDRFGIGSETSNRIDNILIFGEADDTLRPYFDRFVSADRLYGADPSYRAAQRNYVEGTDEDEERSAGFLRLLVGQRRGLFFKIPDEEAVEMRLWDLTVFKSAGEYLERVVDRLTAGGRVERPVLSRLIRGLNRVFTGMLLSNDRELLLATSLASTEDRVSRLLEERVSVEPRLGERVEIALRDGVPTLEVALSQSLRRGLPLHLTRYEFLCRVAEGALPSSFSKECYEDVLAFKSRLLGALAERRATSGEERSALAFQMLDVDDSGKAAVLDLEVRDV